MKTVRILVICRQNVGRSQMAEGFLRSCSFSRLRIVVMSAGLKNIDKMKSKHHNHPHPDVIRVMREVGVDVSKQTIDKVNPIMAERATKILVLCDKKFLPEFCNSYQDKIIYKPIEDPYHAGMDLPTLRKVRDNIECITEDIFCYNKEDS